jgi:glycolate oxidase iron-sulfur subunit
METHLADWIRGTPQGDAAQAILRKCVHCGFCSATCPTYQVLGDELDSPRGRIYLMKQLLEGAEATERTRQHLDRCLTCRACETTCPSGVQYSHLLDVGREVIEARVPRPPLERARRALLAAVLSRPWLFGALAASGRALGPALPRALRRSLNPGGAVRQPLAWPAPRHKRRMIALAGCVQGSLAPQINAAAARLLDRLGVSLVEIPQAGCCGALRFHMNQQEAARQDMRALIDRWWPHLEQGAEAVVMTATGCAVAVRDYPWLLAGDAQYREKAEVLAGRTRDLAEMVSGLLKERGLKLPSGPTERVAFHAPCTLQHGLRLKGLAETLLAECGFELSPVPDAHLCCGSAGTYSLLQPALSRRLRDDKVRALASGAPGRILTANIGCLSHLAGGTDLPVEHWVVALERRFGQLLPGV